MKNLLSVLILSMSLGLAACGGGGSSESSGQNHKEKPIQSNPTQPNPAQPNPVQSNFVLDPNTQNLCELSSKTVKGKEGESCRLDDPNKPAHVILGCHQNQLYLDGYVKNEHQKVKRHVNLVQFGGMVFVCQ